MAESRREFFKDVYRLSKGCAALVLVPPLMSTSSGEASNNQLPS